MATVSKWTPFGVALDITATGGTVTRISATQFTVVINASWETYYSGAKTNYGMTAMAGGVTKTISAFDGTNRSSGSGLFTGTFSISGNGAATKTVTVTFKNFNTDNDDSATKTVSFNVSVPAWTSYTVKYNANGGSGAPSAQTKWKDQTLTLSSTKPTRSGYTFVGWGTSSTDTTEDYSAGGEYKSNSSANLYAIWSKTITLSYNANGGSGAPANQSTTVYNATTQTAFTISGTIPTRSGYNFLGWSTSSTATTATYSAGNSITLSSNSTLYAVWKFAYQKPRITSFSVKRCNSSGTATSSGQYAKVDFKWACDKTVSSIKIAWTSSDGEVTGSTNVAASGTSGTVSQVVGGNNLATNKTFGITVTVTDSGGSSQKKANLTSREVPIDAIHENGEYGVAFGKSAELVGFADIGYTVKHRKNDYFDNNKTIYGTKPNGNYREAFNPQNESGNTVVGYGNYDNKDGNTNIYGHDLNFGVSNIASPGTYRPYRRQGDSWEVTVRVAGYVTNAGKDVVFTIPVNEPIIGSPQVTLASINGFTFRQDNKYTHGSSATKAVSAVKITGVAYMLCGIYVKAEFTDITNVTNNSPIGIHWNGTITLS